MEVDQNYGPLLVPLDYQGICYNADRPKGPINFGSTPQMQGSRTRMNLNGNLEILRGSALGNPEKESARAQIIWAGRNSARIRIAVITPKQDPPPRPRTQTPRRNSQGGPRKTSQDQEPPKTPTPKKSCRLDSGTPKRTLLE